MTVGNPKYQDLRWDADDNRWVAAKAIIGDRRVTLGPQASQQYLDAPDHLAMVLARYRAADALIGSALSVIELGCGEGIGAGILAHGRNWYTGIDTDAEAIKTAGETRQREHMVFLVDDVLNATPRDSLYDAVVSLDVIEHIPAEYEGAFMGATVDLLKRHGICVIGTPNAAFDHLASLQSRAGHINTYTHERLHALLARYFCVVQSFGVNDVSLHTGHPEARHYLMMVGIGPR